MNEDPSNLGLNDSNTDLRIDEDNENESEENLSEVEEKDVIKILKNDLEKSLEEKAAKINLPRSKVKCIIKEVVQSEHVKALLNGDPTVGLIEPKITRAKSKQLNTDPIPAWSPPTGKPSAAVKTLLTEELQEESDDEYVPGLSPLPEISKTADIPEDDLSTTIEEEEDDDDEDNDDEELVEEEEEEADEEETGEEAVDKTKGKGDDQQETLAKRTRSKLHLNSTPLEEIEKAFVPPDIFTDMYEVECEDDLWKEFLSTFNVPLEEVAKQTEDEDQDPEYNVLADDEINEVDTDELKEELRKDKAVNITKKELNNLLNQLFEFTANYESDQKNKRKNQEKPKATNQTVQQPNTLANQPLKKYTIYVTQPSPEYITQPEVIKLIEQQMRQYVQILTQNFILTYEHPELCMYAFDCRKSLFEIKKNADNNPKSIFNTINIHEAIDLIIKWEDLYATNNKEVQDCKVYVSNVLRRSIHCKKRGTEFIPTFPPLILDTISNSKVFIYPNLLPRIPFKSLEITTTSVYFFTPAENQLIAIYLQDIKEKLKQSLFYKLSKSKRLRLDDFSVRLQDKLPWIPLKVVRGHLKVYKSDKRPDNPIKYFFKYGRAPSIIHFVRPVEPWDIIPPAHRCLDDLPYQWKTYLELKRAKMEKQSWELDCDHQKVIITPLVNLEENLIPKPSSPTKITPKYLKIQPRTLESPIIYSKRQRRNVIKKNNKKYRLLRFRMLPDMPVLSTPDKNNASTSSSTFNINTNKCCVSINLRFDDSSAASTSNNSENQSFTQRENSDDLNEFAKSSKNIGSAEKKRLKLRKEFIANLVIATPESLNVLKQKEDNFVDNYFEKLRETLEVEDYDKIMDILCEYDEANGDFSKLFQDIKSIISEKYSELFSEFLLFLTQVQAQKVGQLMPYFILKDMSNFIKKLYNHFKDQPNQIKKIIKCLSDLGESNDLEMEKIKSTILPLLKGNSILSEWFLQIFPTERPQSILLNGPSEVIDLNKELIRQEINQSEDLYETVMVSDTEDPYGGPNCICACHQTDDEQFKTRTTHCKRCGLKFIQGKVYMQTGKGLRPATVSFPTNPDVDHNKRLSVSSQCPKKKQENSPSKNSSPIKEQNQDERFHESEDDEILRKRLTRSPQKRKSKIQIKINLKKHSQKVTSPKGDKQIKKICKKKSDPDYKPGANSGQQKRLAESDSELLKKSDLSSDTEGGESCKRIHLSPDIEDKDQTESDQMESNTNWTREEDRLILTTFQQNNEDKDNFKVLSELLEGRSVNDIKNRFNKLMALLQEMASS